MSDAERDGWLREALRHAPDAGALPPSAVSAAILAEARAAARQAAPRRAARPASASSPLLAFWSWLARPAVAAGFASVMAATLVGLMWWDRPMDEAMPRAPESERADASRVAPPPARVDAPRAAPALDNAAPTSATAPVEPVPAAPMPAAAAAPTERLPAAATAPTERLPPARSAAKADATARREEPVVASADKSRQRAANEIAQQRPALTEVPRRDAAEAFPAERQGAAAASRLARQTPVDQPAADTLSAAPVPPAPSPATAAAPAPRAMGGMADARSSAGAGTPPLADLKKEAAPLGATTSAPAKIEAAAAPRPPAPVVVPAAPAPAPAPLQSRSELASAGRVSGEGSRAAAAPGSTSQAAADSAELESRPRAQAGVESKQRADADAAEAPLATLLASIDRDPASWTRGTEGGRPVALDDPWRAWLGALDAAAAGRWTAATGLRNDAVEAFKDSASTLNLYRAGRAAATLRFDGSTLRLESSVRGGASEHWRATLPPAAAARLRASLARLPP